MTRTTRSEALLSAPSNEKLGASIASFSLPAIASCPGATGACKKVCYALQGHFRFRALIERQHRCWERSRRPDFVAAMVHEIRRCDYRRVRVHAAGDFYEAAYTRKWAEIARRSPEATFFAYTRSWSRPEILMALRELAAVPNFHLWFSEDRDTAGRAPRVPGVRVAMLVETAEDEALVDPTRHDLVFRNRHHRSLAVSGPAPKKEINGVRVCPPEQWYVWNANMKSHREPPKFTCTSCRLCFTRREPVGSESADTPRRVAASPELATA